MFNEQQQMNKYVNGKWRDLKHDDDLTFDFSTLRTSATGDKRSVNYIVDGKTS
jgi:hypothetical protein